MRALTFPLIIGSFVGGFFVSTAARADAIMPPPRHCPPGHQPVSDHGGPRCVANAPGNCPPGWRGVLGGQCVLETCEVGAAGCPAGFECRAAELCGQEHIVEFGWGSAERPRSNVLAEPPHKLNPPRHEFHYDDVCSGGRCGGGSICYQAGVCLSRGVAKAAARPSNGGAARGVKPRGVVGSSAANGPDASGASRPDEAIASGDAGDGPIGAPATDPSALPQPSTAPRSGGCSGCSEAGAPGTALGLAAIVATALVLARRRR